MTIDDQTLRALAFAASRARPSGAKHWPEPVVMEVLRKLASRKLADVALALFRAADDAKAEMPHVLLSPNSPHWRERDTTWTPRLEPFDRAETCGTCGQRRHVCESNPHADHQFESVAISARNGGRDISGVVVELKDHIVKAEPAEVVPIRRDRGGTDPTADYQAARAATTTDDAEPGVVSHSEEPA